METRKLSKRQQPDQRDETAHNYKELSPNWLWGMGDAPISPLLVVAFILDF